MTMQTYQIFFETGSATALYLGEFQGATQAEAIDACYAQLDAATGVWKGKGDVDAHGGKACMFAGQSRS
jgi:hypothetical protein